MRACTWNGSMPNEPMIFPIFKLILAKSVGLDERNLYDLLNEQGTSSVLFHRDIVFDLKSI